MMNSPSPTRSPSRKNTASSARRAVIPSTNDVTTCAVCVCVCVCVCGAPLAWRARALSAAYTKQPCLARCAGFARHGASTAHVGGGITPRLLIHPIVEGAVAPQPTHAKAPRLEAQLVSGTERDNRVAAIRDTKSSRFVSRRRFEQCVLGCSTRRGCWRRELSQSRTERGSPRPPRNRHELRGFAPRRGPHSCRRARTCWKLTCLPRAGSDATKGQLS